jgi:HEXXH motif-containing protein
MRARLADTLDYVFAEVGDAIGVDREAASRATGCIRAEPQSPQTFGAYYEMVIAIEQEELEEARQLAGEILSAAPMRGLRVGAIDDRPQDHAERYWRMFLPDEQIAMAPGAELAEQTQQRIADGLELLDRGFPAMADEIRALLREIVIAAGTDDPKALTFDGVSAYMLWGAVLLNGRGQKSILDMAQALAHESGHNLLFGFCTSGSLVENEDDELFSSPLRLDPRPMDGIVHATYVTARMHQTVARLLESGVLDTEQREAAEKDLLLHQRNFASGDQVVRDNGRLTEIGREVIESARRYMASATAAAA